MTLWLAHPRVHHLSEVNSGLVLSRWTATKDDIPWFCFGVAAQLQPRLVSGDVAGVGCLRVRGLLLRRPLRSTLRESGGSVAVYCSVGGWVGSLKPSEFVGAGTRPVKGRVPARSIRSGRPVPPLRSPKGQHRSDELGRGHSPPLTVHPAPTPPACISRTCRCRKGITRRLRSLREAPP